MSHAEPFQAIGSWQYSLFCSKAVRTYQRLATRWRLITFLIGRWGRRYGSASTIWILRRHLSVEKIKPRTWFAPLVVTVKLSTHVFAKIGLDFIKLLRVPVKAPLFVLDIGFLHPFCWPFFNSLRDNPDRSNDLLCLSRLHRNMSAVVTNNCSCFRDPATRQYLTHLNICYVRASAVHLQSKGQSQSASPRVCWNCSTFLSRQCF